MMTASTSEFSTSSSPPWYGRHPGENLRNGFRGESVSTLATCSPVPAKQLTLGSRAAAWTLSQRSGSTTPSQQSWPNRPAVVRVAALRQ
jgi:hypothetical protein